MCIVWPAFLIAGLLEALVFAAVDPHELHWLGHALPLSRQGIYSLAFFMFWLLAMASSALTLLLAARPLGEPVVQYGPFVMNTREEIEQALDDYREGKLVAV